MGPLGVVLGHSWDVAYHELSLQFGEQELRVVSKVRSDTTTRFRGIFHLFTLARP